MNQFFVIEFKDRKNFSHKATLSKPFLEKINMKYMPLTFIFPLAIYTYL